MLCSGQNNLIWELNGKQFGNTSTDTTCFVLHCHYSLALFWYFVHKLSQNWTNACRDTDRKLCNKEQNRNAQDISRSVLSLPEVLTGLLRICFGCRGFGELALGCPEVNSFQSTSTTFALVYGDILEIVVELTWPRIWQYDVASVCTFTVACMLYCWSILVWLFIPWDRRRHISGNRSPTGIDGKQGSRESEQEGRMKRWRGWGGGIIEKNDQRNKKQEESWDICRLEKACIE